ncbi:hypothetical protein OCA8868_03162 [Octadecabacter ascidiaceicola]|uniref:Uncharacterized protein n=1 Tax=Octadecabacter ascidiaceicola TaxID=1655543 RepID=A0A238KPC4_9RHOB|nr:hypothetical protein OCA8868_03162 [Octadecabacter ascidiaceicola]
MCPWTSGSHQRGISLRLQKLFAGLLYPARLAGLGAGTEQRRLQGYQRPQCAMYPCLWAMICVSYKLERLQSAQRMHLGSVALQ